MNYFRHFPVVNYKFGDTNIEATIENIAIYADVLDQIANATTAYEDYYIQNGQRMDQVTLDLYDAPDYMFTILLLNPTLRECGWPVSEDTAYNDAISKYTHKVITVRNTLTDKMAVGQTISGLNSGASDVITHRRLDLGQIWVEGGSVSFVNGETITSQNAQNQFETATIVSAQNQYNAVHHYENADKEWVDIDPRVGPGAQVTPITYLDFYMSKNEELKNIRVIKASIINDVVESFFEAIK
jgi:hypothetical protein